MRQPLLSVIVPCYNVEKYLDKCIASIVGQTYSNLEIMLVNDGSTDSTGTICNSWKEKYQRISVIHKQNEGVSYARKTGIENATAEYVTFVDADDWIDKNMYADMMAALLSTNSDIAQCDFCIVHEDGRIEHRVQERDATIRILGRVEGVVMILEDHQWRTHLGCKIFKKTLFEHVEFPKGRVYGEDMIVHDLFHRASQTVFINKEFYFYLVRSGSISQQGDIRKEMRKLSDHSDAYFERYTFVKQYPEYHSALPCVKKATRIFIIRLLCNMVACPQYFTDEQFNMKAKQMRSIHFTQEDSLQCGERINLFLLKTNLKLFKFMRVFYNRVIHITNKLKITDKRIVLFIND